MVPRTTVAVTAAQLAGAQTADEYIATTVEQQGIDTGPQDGQLVPESLAGVASDGRPLDSLLYQPAATTVAAMAEGAALDAALTQGLAALLTIIGTQVADAWRAAASVSGTTRGLQWYSRALTPPSCSRCVVLLGEAVSWPTPFKRHPRCDCIHVPVGSPQDLPETTDPRYYFESLSRAEQDRIFTAAGARAIRDGADIARIVNVRRRAAGLGVADSVAGVRRALQRVELANGQFLPVSYSGRKSNRRVLLMPEAIYEIARSHEHTLQLLAANGFISRHRIPQLLARGQGT